ncbi:unnamed protein product, partial [Dicrocoelium dendriticum]
MIIVDGCRKILSTAIALLRRETEMDVRTFLLTFMEIVGGASGRKCIMSDGALTIANAVHNVFPSAHQLFCYIHIISYVIKCFPSSTSFRHYFIAMYTCIYWKYLAESKLIRINDQPFFHYISSFILPNACKWINSRMPGAATYSIHDRVWWSPCID